MAVNEQSVLTYIKLMEEIKVRFAWLDYLMSGQLQTPANLREESCYLQIRMVCELIALGCAVMHDNVPNITRVRKDYQADKIVNEMAKAYPDFFPEPLAAQDVPHGMITRFNGDALTRDGLVALYRRCGEILHKGSVKNLGKNVAPKLDDIHSTSQLIRNLISRHQIRHYDQDAFWIVGMNHGGTGQVGYMYFEKA